MLGFNNLKIKIIVSLALSIFSIISFFIIFNFLFFFNLGILRSSKLYS
jgi:hypothetical protein